MEEPENQQGRQRICGDAFRVRPEEFAGDRRIGKIEPAPQRAEIGKMDGRQVIEHHEHGHVVFMFLQPGAALVVPSQLILCNAVLHKESLPKFNVSSVTMACVFDCATHLIDILITYLLASRFHHHGDIGAVALSHIRYGLYRSIAAATPASAFKAPNRSALPAWTRRAYS